MNTREVMLKSFNRKLNYKPNRDAGWDMVAVLVVVCVLACMVAAAWPRG